MESYSDIGRKVFASLVAPDYEREISTVINSRHRWARIANISEGSAQVLLGISAILAFAAGFFTTQYLSFASASCSTVCLVLMRYAAYASGESTERHAILNRLLVNVGIAPTPGITSPIDGELPLVQSFQSDNV